MVLFLEELESRSALEHKCFRSFEFLKICTRYIFSHKPEIRNFQVIKTCGGLLYAAFLIAACSLRRKNTHRALVRTY